MVMKVVPADFAVTRPLELTEAMLVLPDVHVSVSVESSGTSVAVSR